jgi:hypothetical protein
VFALPGKRKQGYVAGHLDCEVSVAEGVIIQLGAVVYARLLAGLLSSGPASLLLLLLLPVCCEKKGSRR